MNIPSFDEAFASLQEICQGRDPQPDQRLEEADVDSLDLLEWLSAMGLDSEEITSHQDLMAAITELSIREIYDRLIEIIAEPVTVGD